MFFVWGFDICLNLNMYLVRWTSEGDRKEVGYKGNLYMQCNGDQLNGACSDLILLDVDVGRMTDQY